MVLRLPFPFPPCATSEGQPDAVGAPRWGQHVQYSDTAHLSQSETLPTPTCPITLNLFGTTT